MHFPITAALLLTTTLSFTTTTTLASPLPPSSDFNDIERRWSEGQSEVCYISNQPGCFVLAWVQSMMRRHQIHATHSIRDATPAWPVVRAAEDEMIFDPDAFESTTDERTMQERRRMRGKLHRRQKRTTADAGLLAKMRQFVENFMASRDADGVGFIGARKVEDDEAPVLRPRKGMRYAFTA